MAGSAIGVTPRILVALRDFRLGGTERVAIRLANTWCAAGRDVLVLTASRGGALKDLLDPRVPTALVGVGDPRVGDLRIPLRRGLPALLAERPYDVLFLPGNAHWPVARDVLAMPAARRPKVVAQGSNPLNRREKGPLGRWLRHARLSRELRRVDAAIGLHAEMTRELAAVIGRNVAITIPNPALDDDEPAPVPAAADSRRIVVIGRFEPQKNLPLALEAFARLGDRRATLCFVGDGGERRKLARLAIALGVDEQVEFVGAVPSSRPWLDGARMLLLSSDYEGFPAVLVEALAAGRPVVTTAWWKGLPDLLEPAGAGRVTPLGDAAALAQAMRATLESPPPDPLALSRIAQAYRIGPIAEAYLRLFDACCSGAPIHAPELEPARAVPCPGDADAAVVPA